ncbi:MAG: hypothetical protein HW378_185 [Anaerolineales bacterium]|nr:hypothetical protein [Anaerolineales bacterium]
MQLVPYIDLQRQVAEALGRRDEDLQAEDQKAIQRNLSRKADEVWRHWWWHELMRTEKRAFREAYAAATAYAAGDQRFFTATQKYYVALRATTGNDPANAAGETNLDYWAEIAVTYSAANWESTLAYVKGDARYYPPTDQYYQAYTASPAGTLPTDTSKWGPLPLFDRYVHKLQTGKTKIGQIRRVWTKDPHAQRSAAELPWRERFDRVEVFATVATCWVEFKLRAPRLTGDTWDATLAYTPAADEEGTGTPAAAGPGVRTGIPGVVALRALTSHQDNQIEYLLWHTVEFDGGQGNVYFDAASMLTDNNGTVFKPDNIAVGVPGRWLRD